MNARSNAGITALINAAFRGDIVTVKLLVELGADVSARTQKDLVALDFATRKDHTEIVEYLQSLDAKTN